MNSLAQVIKDELYIRASDTCTCMKLTMVLKFNTIIVVFSLMYACKGRCPTVYDDCKAAKTANPDSTSGIYTINPDGGQPFDVSYKI